MAEIIIICVNVYVIFIVYCKSQYMFYVIRKIHGVFSG